VLHRRPQRTTGWGRIQCFRAHGRKSYSPLESTVNYGRFFERKRSQALIICNRSAPYQPPTRDWGTGATPVA